MPNRGATRRVASATEWSPEEIDVLCDAFEDAFRRGENPRIEDYLEQCEGPLRSAVFSELMLVELELREDPEKKSSYSRYLASFPEFSDIIETLAFKHGLTTSHSPGLYPGAYSEPDVSVRENPRTEPGAVKEAPTRIAHFQLQEKLGTGGMGEVWRAWDSRLQRTVAIKLPRNRHLSEQELHRFLREGRAAAQLKHPGIVPVHEVGRDGDLAYIVSDFVAGASLQQLLDQQPLKPLRAAEMCSQLADALHHAHERGIVHRDLKPSNILLSADGNPHVVDFGIAKWADDAHNLTLQGSALGTPAYMSPEQAAGDSSNVDQRADVYALGAILYKMLTGQVPFPGEDPAAILRAVIEKSPPPPQSLRREIPRDLETICNKAMEKKPSCRYATAEAMAADLKRFMRGDPIVGRRPSLIEKAVRVVRKRPALTAAIMLGVLAVTAIGFATFLARENSSLLGLISVEVETNPPGARVVLVPLNETTQEPQGEKAVFPAQRTPLSVKLQPGDYLIVAALDDGRFHEVFRHVPKDPQTGKSQLSGWSPRGGGVALRTINIPNLSVTEGMAWVDPKVVAASQLPPARYPPSFYMDAREVRFSDCPVSVDGGGLVAEEKGLAANRKSHPDHAATVSFDFACYIAESLGKRLPTAGEFQCAASLPKTANCTEAENLGTEFGPAGTPECDRVGSPTPIRGLHSNVAEWTTTALRRAEQDNSPFEALHIPQIALFRIVKGGSMAVVQGSPTLASKDRDAAGGFGIERYRSYPGLGFRGVRSSSPRFLPPE
jgi:serine/threonine-protein kinase